MKLFVHINLAVLIFLIFGCSKQERVKGIIPVRELVEAYVQISLIYESEKELVEKEVQVAQYLSQNNLTRQQVDKALETYRSDPAEWRGFFMKVQTRLRELEAEQRSILSAKENDNSTPDQPITMDNTTITVQNNIANSELAETVDSNTPRSYPIPVNISSEDVIKLDPTSVELTDTETPVSLEIPINEDSLNTLIEKVLPYTFELNEDNVGVFSYTVQRGNNLSTIAYENDTDISQLTFLNSIENVNKIRIGQTILIPNKITTMVIHTIKSGEALSKITKEYDSDLEQIIKINKITNIDVINTGDFLYLPIHKLALNDTD